MERKRYERPIDEGGGLVPRLTYFFAAEPAMTRGSGNETPVPIKAYVRLRPQQAEEVKADEMHTTRYHSWSFEKNDGVLTREVVHTLGSTQKVEEESFQLMHVGMAGSPYPDAYEAVGREPVEAVLTGTNGCLLAYGQAKSGKTYTMSGEGGVLWAAVRDLFEGLQVKEGTGTKTRVIMTLCELKEEEITDLLCTDPSKIGGMKILPCAWKATTVKGLREVEVADAAHFKAIFKSAHARRSLRSRSPPVAGYSPHAGHCLLELTVAQRPTDVQEDALVAALTVIDLAGDMQRLSGWSTEKPMGQSSSNASATHQSLAFLRSTIARLGQHKGKGHTADTLAGYRDCKLTRLLTDALGGNSVTAMICTLSPALVCATETLGTLRVASQAARIFNHPMRNLVPGGRVVLEPRRARTPRVATTTAITTNTTTSTSASDTTPKTDELITAVSSNDHRTTSPDHSTTSTKNNNNSKKAKEAIASFMGAVKNGSSSSSISNSSSSSSVGRNVEIPRTSAMQERNLNLLKELEKTHAALALSMHDREETRQQLAEAMTAIQVLHHRITSYRTTLYHTIP
jgi:hypothetical protein